MRPNSRSVWHLRSAALRWSLVATLLTVLLRWAVPADAVESIYSRGLFPWLRLTWDATISRLPLPLFYVCWILVIAGLVYLVRQHRRAGSDKWLATGRRLLTATLWLVTIFLWGWGFNYGRAAVEDQMSFAPHDPGLEELRDRVFSGAEELADLRDRITRDTQALETDRFPLDLEAAIRPLVAAALRRHGYPAPGNPRAWALYPKGILLRLSTAGVYWPWAGQGNVDAGLHVLQRPAVMAHELAHAYGFGDEGTCSFWAWLCAAETEDPALRYALLLGYWRHLAGDLRYADPAGYLAWRAESLAPGIRNDLAAIYANGELYQDIAPAIRDATYTAYLQAQGIHEGLLNYGRVVRLVEGYRTNFRSEAGR